MCCVFSTEVDGVFVSSAVKLICVCVFSTEVDVCVCIFSSEVEQ